MISTFASRLRSITTPPSLVPKPAKLWPPPRTDSKSPAPAANRTPACTSSTLLGRRTQAGLPAANSERLADSYSGPPGSMMSPPKSRRRVSSTEFMTFLSQENRWLSLLSPVGGPVRTATVGRRRCAGRGPAAGAGGAADDPDQLHRRRPSDTLGTCSESTQRPPTGQPVLAGPDRPRRGPGRDAMLGRCLESLHRPVALAARR